MNYHYLQELTSLLLRNEELKDTIKNLEEEMVFYQGMLSIQTSNQIETGPASPEQQVPGLWTVEEDFLEQYLWCMHSTVVVPTRSLVAEGWLHVVKDVNTRCILFYNIFWCYIVHFFSNENFLILLSFNQTRISYIWLKNFGDFLFLIETVFVVNFSWELRYIYIFSFFIHILDLVLRENKQTSLHY